MIDESHSPAQRSWVASANQHADFPIQNLPLCVFAPARGGVAIGDEIFDLAAALELGLFDGLAARAAQAACGAALNPLFALGREARVALRRVGDLLDADGRERAKVEALRSPPRSPRRRLPPRASGGDRRLHRLFRRHPPRHQCGQAVPPRQSAAAELQIRAHRLSRPRLLDRRVGRDAAPPERQRKPSTETIPSFGPSRSLDYELELGVWIGPGNELGTPVAIADAASHIAGFCLLNDWSARDIQAWEYQPLGPFLGKSFFTTISPWVVTPEALAPFRTAQAPRPAGDPAPLPYLFDAADQAAGALDVDLEVLLLTPGLRAKGLAPQRLSVGNARHLYWTVAQLVAHHSSGGCNLRAGDLFGTGTISAPEEGGRGSLLEISAGGRRPVELSSGESRRFLEDGDTVIMRARCAREGFATIGLGECRGTVAPAI